MEQSKKWSIGDPTFGTRTIEEIKFSTGKKFNCKVKPLFDFVPMDHGSCYQRHIIFLSQDFRCFN